MYKIYYTDCGTDYSIQNGFANFAVRSTIFQENVPVTCMNGYELYGDEHITCLEDGNWSGNVTCRIKSTFHSFIYLPLLHMYLLYGIFEITNQEKRILQK